MKTLNITVSDIAHYNMQKKQEELSTRFNKKLNMPEVIDIVFTEMFPIIEEKNEHK